MKRLTSPLLAPLAVTLHLLLGSVSSVAHPLDHVVAHLPAFSQDALLTDSTRARDPRLIFPIEPRLGGQSGLQFLGPSELIGGGGLIERDPLSPIWDPVFGSPGRNSSFRLGFIWDGPSPYARRENETFFPASTSKLWTAAAALETLGPDYRFQTALRWWTDSAQPGVAWRLTLIGDGDPTWGMVEFGETDVADRIRQFVLALRESGIREVRGGLYVGTQSEHWDRVRFPLGWLLEDRVSCYGAQAQGFNLGGNCAELVVEGPGAIRFRWAEVSVPIQDEMRWGTTTQVFVEPIDFPTAASGGFKISGTWKKGSPPLRDWLPVHNVESWVRNLFERELITAGIQLRPDLDDLPDLAQMVSREFQSPPLSEILVPFLKLSLNWIGDSLLKKMGQRSGLADRFTDFLESGVFVLNRWAAGAVSERGSVILQDGSGVSHASFVTPQTTHTLLKTILRSPHFPVIWNALPIAGVDGTLARRMLDTPAQGWVRAKTGTLSESYNLAGFVPDVSWNGEGTPSPDRVIPFVTLVQTAKSNGSEARAVIDRTGAQLSRLQRER